jgi:hypothetical protein
VRCGTHGAWGRSGTRWWCWTGWVSWCKGIGEWVGETWSMKGSNVWRVAPNGVRGQVMVKYVGVQVGWEGVQGVGSGIGWHRSTMRDLETLLTEPWGEGGLGEGVRKAVDVVRRMKERGVA